MSSRNILTESARLPVSVIEHAGFSLPRVILASRSIGLIDLFGDSWNNQDARRDRKDWQASHWTRLDTPAVCQSRRGVVMPFFGK